MKWIKYETDNYNILNAISDVEFANLEPNESQIELDWDLPLAIQPVSIYRYNEIDEIIEPYLQDTFVIESLLGYQIDQKPISSINYKTELKDSIFPDRVFENGLLQQVRYFKTRDEATGNLSDQILQVDIVYTLKEDAVYNSAKTVESRETTRRWMLSLNSLDEATKKITNKYYPHITESRAEGRKRRDNIFNITSKDMIILLMFTQTAGDQEAAEVLGIQMAGSYEKEFSNFTKIAAAQPLVDAITNDATYGWLDNAVPSNPTVQFLIPLAIVGETIREYILRAFKGDL